MNESTVGETSVLKTRYEENDRRYNLFQLPLASAQNHWGNSEFCQQVQDVAKNVACLVSQDKLAMEEKGGRRVFRLRPIPTLNRVIRKSWGAYLEKNEAFAHERVLGDSTAFLIGNKYALTAGHCVTKDESGKKIIDSQRVTQLRLVFGFRMTTASCPKKVFAEDDIYSIHAVLAYEDGQEDWALLELDRVVSQDRKGLALSLDPIPPNSEVYMLGHPHGLPIKVSIAARVLIDRPSVFEANLDANDSNSGSPVLTLSHQVVGILSNGPKEKDYVMGNKRLRAGIVSREEQSSGVLETCTKISSLTFVHATLQALEFINPLSSTLDPGLTLLGDCADQKCKNITKFPVGFGMFHIHEIVVTYPFLCHACSKIVLVANKTMVAIKNAQIAIKGKNADKVIVERTVTCKDNTFAMSFDQWYFLDLTVEKI